MSEVQPADSYDVAILGGGLAGLTLGLQLKQQRARDDASSSPRSATGPAPEAAFKVGESTVEISCHYFGEVLGLKDHLEKEQIHKCGLRFWFPAGDNSDLAAARRARPAEPPAGPHLPARPRPLRERPRRAVPRGRRRPRPAARRVQDVELGDDEHAVTFDAAADGDDEHDVKARWVVDASGRAFILKQQARAARGQRPRRQLVAGSGSPAGSTSRTGCRPDDEEFFGRMEERGLRMLSTNHLCGEGYWVWLIPLSSGPISIGIVADPRFHPWERDQHARGRARLDPRARAAARRRRSRAGATRSRTSSRSRTSRTAASRSSRRERWCLVGEAGAVPRPVLLAGLGLHRDGEHVHDRPDHARPRRRGRRRARRGPQRPLPDRLPGRT